GVYDDLGEKQKALQFLNQALPIYRAVGDKRGEARTLNNIGGVYDALGEKQKALQFYNQALPLRRAVGDKGGEGTTLNNIGAVYNDLGEKQKALQFLNQALPIHRAVGDRGGEATNLNNIGQIYDDLGEKQEALQFYNQALPIYRAVGDRGGEATTANNIARVYNDLGEKQKALQFLNQALPLFRAIGDRGGEATNLNNIGAIYNDLREKQKALRFYNQALPIYRAVGDRDGEATTLNNIGAVYNDLGEKQKALQFLDQALPIYHAVGDRGGEASVLNNIGLTYYDLREKQKALQFLNQALPLRRAVGDRGGEAAILGNIALLEMNQGNLQEALNKVEDAIKIIEDLRTKVVSPELRTSYFATKQGYYQFKINLLMHLHKQNLSKGYDAQALETSDRARARSLVELLTEANANIREGIKPELLERERNLQQKLNALEKQKLELASRPNTEKKIADIKQQIDKLLDDYQQLRTEIRLNSRRYADLKFPESLTLKEIQQKILDDDTLLLTYSLGEERSYLWLVSKTEIHSYELPKRAEIEAQAKQFHGYLKANPNKFTSQAATDIGKQSATKLSQMLLQPVAKKLSNKRLLIVSDGALQYVPFTALPVCQDATCNVSTPLLANHEIINSPSVSTIAILRSEQQQHKLAPKTLAVLADPVFSKDDTRLSCQGKQDTSPAKINPKNQSENLDSLLLERSARESDVNFRSLPFTCQEAEGIFLEPKSSIKALRFDANRAFAMNPQLSQYRYIHFATHGILNSTNPQLSGVVLSLVNQKGETENGFLRLNDIFNLKLPAELVVLSACETALGKEVRGEGLVGLTRGFMYAGSPRLVVSLWKVQDEGTSVLMKKFYTKMLLQGLKPAEALRAAQLEMSQDKKYFAPYYWAGFTLQGEWK
ncbi:CHAT domain-containing protein, partial [Nostoc sp.]